MRRTAEISTRKALATVGWVTLIGLPAGGSSTETMPAPISQESAQEAILPTPACLRALRAARVSRMNDAQDEELARLRTAAAPCSGRPEHLIELLSYARRHGLPEAEHKVLHQELLVRLRDTTKPVPRAMASHLIFERGLEEDLLEATAEAYARRVNDDPQASVEDLRIAATAMERTDRLLDATALWERFRELLPTQGSDWKLVTLYEQTEQWSEAAEALQRATQYDSGLTDFWAIRVVHNLVRAAEYAQALKLIELMTRTTEAPLAGLALDAAWAFRDAGLDTEAEKLFRLAAAATDTSSRALGVRHGEAQRQARQAIAHFYANEAEREELLSGPADQADEDAEPFALYERGTELLTSGQLEEAFELLSRAAPGIGDLEAAWYNLALTSYRLKRWEPAAEAYGQAGALNADRPDVWFFRGLALVNLERWSEAAESLEKALALDPERTLAHYHLANCYAQTGDTKAASRHLESWNASKEQR